MPQTLLAFLAMLLTMLFSMNQQRSMLSTQRDIIDAEMELMASGVAVQVIEHIGAQPFDAKTADGTVTVADGNTGELTTIQPGRCAYEDCTYIGAFHGMPAKTFTFEAGENAFDFVVTARVRYVDEDGEPSVAKTFYKEVTVVVDQRATAGGVKFLLHPVTLSRTFSYPR